MHRPPPAIRHLIAHRVAFAVVILTALTTATFTAAAVSFFSAVTAGAAASELSGRPGSVVTVSAPATPATIERTNADIARTVRGLLPGLRPRILSSSQSDVLNLPGPKSARRPQTQIISLPGLRAHIIQVRGHCGAGSLPAGARALPACMPASAATALGLATGDAVTLRDPTTHALIPVRITGTFRRARTNSQYWLLDPLGPGAVRRGGGFATAGPLVISPVVAASARFAAASVSMLAIPDLSRLHGTGIAALGNHLATKISNLNSAGNFHNATIASGLPARLTALATALVVARTKILAGMVTLLVIGGATLALAARLLSQRREAETALVGARGASRVQVAKRGLTDAVVVAVPAAVAGPLLASLLAPLLVRRLTTGLSGTAWLAAALVAAGCVAVIALPWLRRPLSPLRQRARRGRQRAIAAAVYARADLALVAIAGGALWQLIRSAGPVSTGLDGTLSADPVLVVAPVLALAGGALLTLRALPVAARLGDRMATRGRGLVVPAAAWQLSRRALREAGPTLVAVLAVAAAVMALAQRDSWQRSVQAQASYAVGADARITMPPAAPLPIGSVSAITAARGVAASTPAVRSTFSLPDGSLGTLLAVNTGAAASIIPAQADGPKPGVLRGLASAPPVGVRLPGKPAALSLTAVLGRGHLAKPVLFVQLMDAAGIGYLLPAGPVRADGKPHRLSIVIAPLHHADYPLRLTGFTLQFNVPHHKLPADTLTISGGIASPAVGSPAGTAFPLAPAGGPLVFSATKNTGGIVPTALHARTTSRGAVVAAFKPGATSNLVGNYQTVQTGLAQVEVAESFRAEARPVPAVVTRSLLARSGQRIGGRMQVGIAGTTVLITPVAAVANLPTVGGGNPGVLVDQRALGDALQAGGAPPVSVTEWWLRTSGRPNLTGLPPGTAISTRAGIAKALLADPLLLASQQALLAIAVAAVLLALVGMLVSVATASERARDLALLDALGMPPRQIARMLALGQAMTAVATSAVGLVFGALLSRLIVPAITLTAQAVRPVPPLVVQVPWLAGAVIAAVMAAVPTIAIMLTTPRAGRGAAMIRLESEA